MQDIAQHGGSEARGVGVNEDEEGLVAQHLGAEAHEGEEILLQLPHLAAGAATVGGRVHDDGIVSLAAANLTLHELGAVVHDPADGGIGKTRETGVLLGPRHHALCRVHMAHAGTRLGAGNGCAACVGEEVQHADGAVSLADGLHGEIPVHRLLGEQTRVLEVHGLDLEGQFLIVDRPALREGILLPVTAARLRTAVAGVGLAPQGAPLHLPNGLRVGAHQDLVVPALQFLTAAAGEQFIIFPAVRNPHISIPPMYRE